MKDADNQRSRLDRIENETNTWIHAGLRGEEERRRKIGNAVCTSRGRVVRGFAIRSPGGTWIGSVAS